MIARCQLCDATVDLPDRSPEAKHLINRPLATYLCPTCKERIAEQTNRRKSRSINERVDKAEEKRDERVGKG